MSAATYNAVADVLRRTKPLESEYAHLTANGGIVFLGAMDKWREIVRKTAETFAQQNSNFKRMRFFRACTLDPQDIPAA